MENVSKARYTVVEILADDPLLVYNVGTFDFLTAVGISYMLANERIEEMKEASDGRLFNSKGGELYTGYKLTPIECMEGDEDFIISLLAQEKGEEEYKVDRQYTILLEHKIEENRYFPDIFHHEKKEGE